MSGMKQDPETTSDPGGSAEEQLETTAEGWRKGLDDPDAAHAAEEVARGADRAAEQPDFGREGS